MRAWDKMQRKIRKARAVWMTKWSRGLTASRELASAMEVVQPPQ
jgi:hypothetical protein